ncbi:epithelial cell adhesion molecule S homeolog [Xenopus laevis]|uniref:Epithelial cell adhesion molecule S homeolog n=1 Tax=Xenopus laevis TaxID=8355 RepID=Q6DCY7_XENLA|nr:epithelial cell adhesion molecule S homeolog [Xenopus laevis]AAH77845.1 Tacstd1-prov protein [Xenopus laevis]
MCLVLVAQVQSQGCKCRTHYMGKCDNSGASSDCQCTLTIGPDSQPVNCSKLIPKCWLMKRESLGTKAGRRVKPAQALIDNDGLYNPECDTNGVFKARQCNNTDTCWCVNTAGVRRTDKGDKNWKCPELVRTNWVYVEMKRNNTDSVNDDDLKKALKTTIVNRYGLPEKCVSVELEGPSLIYVDLKQNGSQKLPGEVDITDVAYYMEKDIKGDSLFHPDEKFEILVNGNNFAVKEPIIYYIDEKPHEISMKHLTPGVIAVIVVVVLAIVALIAVLIFTRRKRGKYQKAEMKELNEMQQEAST